MSAATLSDEQRLDWLRLIRSENVGPRTFRALINKYGGAGRALEALPDLARKGGRLMLKVTTREEALREIEAADRMGARFIAMGEPDYPKPLQAADSSPPIICVRGNASVLSKPAAGIIGSRNASASGLTFTTRLARDLADAGFVVISGLARGIDTAAHKAAVNGSTAAVFAGGQDKVYPQQNQALLEKIIAEGGAAVSEMPFGWEPRARDFPRRNRIVSGLSLGVVVIEAARRSGSLITARFANEQGREVFAVPGSPLDPRSEGTNDLIRQGATLCSSSEHVISALMPLVDTDWEARFEAREPDEGTETLWEELDFLDFEEALAPVPRAPVNFDDEMGANLQDGADARSEPGTDAKTSLLDLLGPSPVSIDDLSRQSGLPVRAVQGFLLEFEIDGRLERHGGNAVSLIDRAG
jgi:DNA processing protein